MIVCDQQVPIELTATDVASQQCPECLRREQKFKERSKFRVGYLVDGKCDRCVFHSADEK